MYEKAWKSLYALIYTIFLLCFPCEVFCETTLSFDEAVSKTLSLSPRLRIAGSEINEKAGAQVQSSLLPNPVAAYSVENVLGNKNWQGWESAESRYEVGQLIELGGKRGFRYQTAKFQYYASQAGFEAKQLSVLNRLLKLFTSVVASQENLQLALDQTRIAEEVYKTVSAKVEAGKVSLIQQNKAEIALSTAQINLEKARADFFKNRERLSTLWGSSYPDFERAVFPFYEIDLPKPIEKCLSDLRENPELLRSQMEHLAAHQNLNLEKSLAIPDVTVTLGYKTLQDTGNKGMILGASIPIPLFNQNQGNIQKARAQTVRTHDQYIELELALENKLSIAHRELARAYMEAEKIRSTVLKAAVQSFELAQEGYKEGKFEYLDMLDSQKTLFEVRERYIQALLNYHQSIADIEYLNTLEEGL
uniref:Putative cobalt-zinc-cadmium resistance protein CzcC n=1 Tax=Candidatus Criblamydia sequanensis CRIB-18 TaxID=1437425 RepID=A0A090D3F5_9BACT|nr:TolC family protein [Criblamydia sequanensis]CDR35294.1 putative cobalt-zinc-cadmium resistance protein CzcC [Criblamydia sequanensis CRIB-18]